MSGDKDFYQHEREQAIRAKLAEINRLRAEAQLCDRMHTHGMYSDNELVEIQPVIVRRRWRTDKKLHSERVMTSSERDLFRSWLSSRRTQLDAKVEVLTNELNGSEGVDDE